MLRRVLWDLLWSPSSTRIAGACHSARKFASGGAIHWLHASQRPPGKCVFRRVPHSANSEKNAPSAGGWAIRPDATYRDCSKSPAPLRAVFCAGWTAYPHRKYPEKISIFRLIRQTAPVLAPDPVPGLWSGRDRARLPAGRITVLPVWVSDNTGFFHSLLPLLSPRLHRASGRPEHRPDAYRADQCPAVLRRRRLRDAARSHQRRM